MSAVLTMCVLCLSPSHAHSAICKGVFIIGQITLKISLKERRDKPLVSELSMSPPNQCQPNPERLPGAFEEVRGIYWDFAFLWSCCNQVGPKSAVMRRNSGGLMWLGMQSLSVHTEQIPVLRQQLLDTECDQHSVLQIHVFLGSAEIN